MRTIPAPAVALLLAALLGLPIGLIDVRSKAGVQSIEEEVVPMWKRGVVDRIVEGEHAVLLLGEDEVEWIVALAALPSGSSEGTWLRLRFDADHLIEAQIDSDEEARRRHRIAEKLGRLQARGRTRPGE